MSEPQNERWLTYVELGELLDCSASAARVHARRKGSTRRTANMIGEPTRVLVPSDATVPLFSGAVTGERLWHKCSVRPNGQEEANSAAVAVLREQLAVANGRIDDLNEERQRDAEERRRLVALLSGLGDTRAAAAISRNLAAGAPARAGAVAQHPPVVATVASVSGAMRSGASIALLVGAALIQCYATRTGEGCAPLSEHATMAECRALAKEYGKFDTRALNVTGLPVVVSYRCVTAEPGAGRLNAPSSPP